MKPDSLRRRLLSVGATLLAGSALAFAALNQGARVQDGAFFYWQRYFVDNIVATANIRHTLKFSNRPALASHGST